MIRVTGRFGVLSIVLFVVGFCVSCIEDHPTPPEPQVLQHANKQRTKAPKITPSKTITTQPPMENKPASVTVNGNRPNKAGANVVLIVVDTERADSTTPYGADRPTTPFFKRIAKQGILFKNAFSPAPWTVPAMFSMMTGLYPSEHGAKKNDNARFRSPPVLPDQALTLAEYLKDNGYTTFGINTNYTLQPKFGFAQGFDRFIGKKFAFFPFPNLALDSLIPEIQKAPSTFVWLHYFDPHQPFHTYSPWFGSWNDSSFGSYIDLISDLSLRMYRKKLNFEPGDPVLPEHAEMVHNFIVKFSGGRMFSRVYEMFRAMPELLTDNYYRFVKAAYLSSIRKTDEAIKEAFVSLGVDNKTLVIITSDHGEEFLDHGDFGHHITSLYQELIHVPLVILLPGREKAGSVIEAPVSTLDIMPTVIDILELPIPKELSGQSLKPLIKGKKVSTGPIYSEVDTVSGQLRCVIDYPWKYIHDTKNKTSELYNLKSDPQEKTNLNKNMDERTSAMHKTLLEWIEKTQPRWSNSKKIRLSAQDMMQLRGLGYLDGPKN